MTNETISADWEDRPFTTNPYIELVKEKRFVFVYGHTGWMVYTGDQEDRLRYLLGVGHPYEYFKTGASTVGGRLQWEVTQGKEGLEAVITEVEKVIAAYKVHQPATPKSHEDWGGWNKTGWETRLEKARTWAAS